MSDNISQDLDIEGEGNIVIGKARDVIINPLPPVEARLRHDLGILLKNVETTWIKGILEKSIHEAVLLELGIEVMADAVDNPWDMVLEGTNQTRQTLPRGTKIKDIFNDANRLLLILGEPGSGKTTTLLQLARDLMADIDQTFTQPVPVILNLSTWTNKQQSLVDWVVAELNSKYHLPKKDGRRWFQERRILPLLDGLDEVKAENRATCVEKINRLAKGYGLQGIVVCSRIKDYTALNVRLAFYGAIFLQSLTSAQVDEYLNIAGEKLATLRATLQADEALQVMAQSPLILSIMSLAYQNASAESLNNLTLETDEARRKHLFDTYIARMFKRKAGSRLYEDQKTAERLSWLASNMKQQSQEMFLIEGLQPSWLSTRGWQLSYLVVSRLINGLIMAGVGLAIYFIYAQLWSSELILVAPILGLSLAVIDVLRFEWLRRRAALHKTLAFWLSLVNIIVVVIISGLIFGITYIATYSMNYLDQVERVLVGLLVGLPFGSCFGLIFGLRGSRQNLAQDMQTIEELNWSWQRAFRGMAVGVIGGLIIGSITGITVEWGRIMAQPGSSIDAQLLFNMLFCGLIGGTVGVILNGLQHKILETKTIPDQGIRLLIQNAVIGGLIAGLIGELFFGLMEWLTIGETSTSIDKLRFGLLCGLTGALWYGGFDMIQHYTLRLILIVQGHTPRNYSVFLDDAVDHIFLQKVGSGYRFIHRLLLEHFANMYDSKL